MAALTAGTKAPDFELKAMDGKRFVLREELAKGRWCWRFSRCHARLANMHFRFLIGWTKAYGQRVSRLVGVSQNDPKRHAAFSKEFGVTFPLLLDDPRQVSRIKRIRTDERSYDVLDRARMARSKFPASAG